MIEINEMTIRVPGIGEAEGQQLGQQLAAHLAGSISGQLEDQQMDSLHIQVTMPSGLSQVQMIENMVSQILGKLK